MRNSLRLLIFSSVMVISIISILNIEVTIQQGVNYKLHAVKEPLYLKLLDFFDRHYNYKTLTARIISGTETEQNRIEKILEWTYMNLKRVPEGMPVIDDHVWHIIVRGYGTDDQYSDVFTTLCNYARVDSFFAFVYNQDQTKRIPLSFVKLKRGWCVFDPYYGVYFKNAQDEFASIEEVRSQKVRLIKIENSEQNKLDYAPFIINLPTLKEIGLQRANIQSPLRRLIFEMKKWIK